MNNKKKILIISGIFLISLFIIGVSYAFFSAIIKGNDIAKENVFTSGTMELTFTDNDDAISLPHANPGDSDSKTFTVENTGTLEDAYTYNIKLTDLYVTFQKKDLTYNLIEYTDDNFNVEKEEGIKTSGYINTNTVNENNEMYLAVNITRPEKGKKHYYKLTITFEEIDIPQDYNQGAKFRGKINVDDEVGKEIYKVPNAPELYQGMIPIYFRDSKIYIADASKDYWYNYDEHEWANAVLIDHTNEEVMKKFYTDGKLNVGKEITSDDVLQMYVWIPRYKYQLFNVNNDSIPKQIINIEFENGTDSTGDIECTYTNNGDGTITENCTNKETRKPAQNGEWYTHPAFTFGSTELTGIWVGKFEPSDPTDNEGKNNNTIGGITILPNKVSMTIKNVKVMFDSIRDIEQKGNKYNLNSNEIDTHMMKNNEWGAVAYLSQSFYGIFTGSKQNITCNITGKKGIENCFVWNNNTSSGEDSAYGTITGCVASTQNETAISNIQMCPLGYEWNNNSGINRASTTTNIYGVYDMAGGMWEYVMGNMVDTNGAFNISDLGLTNKPFNIDAKYYDSYAYDLLETSHSRGHLGDATRETLENFDSNVGSWNNDYSFFPEENNSWFIRGGRGHDLAGAGIFAYFRYGGAPSGDASFRVVLTAQDGID